MIKDILSGYKSAMPSGVHTELRAQVNRNRVVGLMGGNIIKNDREDISGVSARSYKNGVYGFASMAELSDEAVKKVLKASLENANFLDTHINKQREMFPPIASGKRIMDVNMADPEQKTYVEILRMLDAYIADKCPELIDRMLVATSNGVEKLLICSDGYDAHANITRSHIKFKLTAMGEKGNPVDLSGAFGGYGSMLDIANDMPSLYAKVDEIYERLMQKRNGVYPEAGVKTVVMGSTMAGILAHEAVGHTVEADLVIGGSVAGPYLGKQVASELVSLTDLPILHLANRLPSLFMLTTKELPPRMLRLLRTAYWLVI